MNTKKNIGIIFAMHEELEAMIKLMPDIQTSMLHHCIVAQTHYHGKQLYLISAGIGKANAAIATTLLIKEYDVDLILNVGIAGSVSNELKTGDVLLSDTAVYYDVDATVFGYQHGQVPRMPAYFQSTSLLFSDATHFAFKNARGLVCSGDSFLTSKHHLDAIAAHYENIYAIDMEAAAIAQTCHHFAIPFLMVKGISDHVDQASTEDSENNLALAMNNALEMTLFILKGDD